MATKAQLIAILIAAGIPEDQTVGKSVTELNAIAAEHGVNPNPTQDQPDAAQARRADDDPRTGVKVKCRIEYSTDPGGREDVYGSINGYNFVAKRGQEIDLDEGFVDHLESIVITDTEVKLDGNGKPTGELLEVNRNRFQVTRLKSRN